MIKKILKYLLVLIVLLLIGGWFFIQKNKPVYKGNIQLNNLEEKITVYFDDIGVPHIYAQNQHDAYVALGYVHAQDRLWQMELVRRISAGRLSELFGEDMVDTDKFFKGIGIERAAEKAIRKLDTSSQAYILTQAYLNGINQFIENGSTPVEFRLIGIEKEKFTIKDVYNVFGYMSISFAQAHKTDPFLTNLRNKLGDVYLNDLAIDINPKTSIIKNYNRQQKVASNISGSVNKIMDNLIVPPFIGSNSWVVGAKKTKNKKVIFANDPHIGFAQPAVWYQSHIITPDFELYGFNLALTPFALLGHNHEYAYGITMFENDDIDFYKEAETQTYETRKETIKVKDGDDVTFEVKVGRHGPIMNDFMDALNGDNKIAMDWIYTKLDNKMLAASYEISHARSLSDFKKGASKIIAPGLNLMYGDAKDNVAWFASAKLYTRNNKANTKFILDGTNVENDQLSYLDFSQNPQAINPRWNYVYSANNQPGEIGDGLYPGYYLSEDRAKRIVDLLESKNDFTRKDMEIMINDVQSSVIPNLIPVIIKDLSKVNLSNNEKRAIEILEKWNGSFKRNEVAPTIYTKFLWLFIENTFVDELGEDGLEQFLETHVYKRQIAKQINNRKSVWWDDITTKNIKEDRHEIFTKSFHQSITSLEEQFGDEIESWTWNKAISVTHKHVFDKVGVLRGFFNVGPFVTDGTNEVLNNQGFSINKSGLYEVEHGPSTRRIIDFSDVENAVAIVPTGQSGNVFSKHYKDQAQKYLNGEFVKMMLNKKDIQKSTNKLVLIPVE
ncbi:MAG: penicillin acylase family protein [Flavobacteriaceae bacterium]|nr:penicillin acylase family protein [Flavobacteriaceae bacterium]